MRPEIDVSVIVPFLNEERHLPRCIDSLLNQDFDLHRVEFLFVDNNSTDGSAAIVSAVPGLELHSVTEPNVYTARNHAIRHATGRVLAFTDADCVVSPNWLRTILEALDRDGFEIVMGEREFAAGHTPMAGFVRDFENLKIEHILLEEDFKRCFGFTNNMAVTRAVYDELGGFDETIELADTDFVLRYVRSRSRPRIAYRKAMSIEHLEIDGWWAWMRKLVSYGRRSPKSKIPLHLSRHQHRRFLAYCVRERRYSRLQRVGFGLTALSADIAYLVPYLLFGGWRLVVRDEGSG